MPKLLRKKGPRPSDRYLSAALRLQSSIWRNSKDAKFADIQKNEITYVYDANVFIFYADFEDRQRLFSDLDALLGVYTNNDVQHTIERLTADFLFSGKLPGQKNSVAYVSVPHLNEIMNKSNRLSEEIADARNNAEPIDEKEVAARRSAIRGLMLRSMNPEEKLRELSRVLPRAWIASVDRGNYYARRMREAFLGPSPNVRVLDREEWGFRAGEVRQADVTYWRKLMPAASLQRAAMAISDDATTLATIANLYRGDPDSWFDDRERLYLFITSDSAIAKAVKRAEVDLAREGIPNFVRETRDYTPLLNLSAMREAVSAHLSKAAEMEFRKVFELLGSALDWIEKAAGGGDRPIDIRIMSQQLASLQKAWSAATKLLPVMNAGYLRNDADELFGEVAMFAATDRSTTIGTRGIRKAVTEVRANHTIIVLRSALEALVAARRGLQTVPPRRVQLKLIGELFKNLIAKGDINEFLDEAVSSGRIPEETERKLIQNPDGVEAQLLAACLFMAADRWSAAAEFSGRASELFSLNHHSLNCEGRYFYALCLRFVMRSPWQFSEASKLLRENLFEYSEQRQRGLSTIIRRIRDELELGTLFQASAIQQKVLAWNANRRVIKGLDDVNFIPGDLAGSFFSRSAQLLVDAYDELVFMEPIEPVRGTTKEFGSTGDLNALVKSLKIQGASNILGAHLFAKVLGRLAVADPRPIGYRLDELERLIEAEEKENRRLRPTQYVYRASVRSIIAPTIHERHKWIDEALGAIDGAATYGTLPLGDRMEFAVLKAAVQQLRAGTDIPLV